MRHLRRRPRACPTPYFQRNRTISHGIETDRHCRPRHWREQRHRCRHRPPRRRPPNMARAGSAIINISSIAVAPPDAMADRRELWIMAELESSSDRVKPETGDTPLVVCETTALHWIIEPDSAGLSQEGVTGNGAGSGDAGKTRAVHRIGWDDRCYGCGRDARGHRAVRAALASSRPSMRGWGRSQSAAAGLPGGRRWRGWPPRSWPAG